jgi:hypothetical protein
MTTILKPYFDCEGPFGLPMKDKQAQALEARLKALPRDAAFGLRRAAVCKGVSEVIAEGRCEVSWITAQAPDRAGDVVLARGMDDSHFQLNPVVTWNHHYDRPPVGRSLWRRRVRDGTLAGVKAKTVYPPRPANWSQPSWPPDDAFALIQSGLLLGKSIGFFPLEVRAPTAQELEQPGWQGVRNVIEKWLLAEYACCVLPMQPHAVVEEIGEGGAVRLSNDILHSSLPVLHSSLSAPGSGAVPDAASNGVAFTALSDIEKRVPALLGGRRLERALLAALERSWRKLGGRV